MFREVINTLTSAQRAQLAAHGINDKRLSSWRTGERLPTEVQTAYLADATGLEWIELQKEITILRADETERATVARVVGWHGKTPGF